MPEFDTYVDVDVDDFISACSEREITELVVALIDEGLDLPAATCLQLNPHGATPAPA